MYIKTVFVIACIWQFTFLFSQNNPKLIFENIPETNFCTYTSYNEQNLFIYGCAKCSFNIEYIRDQTYHKYNDSFRINKKVYKIDELLDYAQMDFYNVKYNKKKYLFVSSGDYGPSRFSYLYRHYYLFILDKKNNVVGFKKLVVSKLNKREAFFKLTAFSFK
ncbi:hypothetical protein [Flavobacterium chilense]|uniref:Uncharacterized protein n=1 Tax=Flavobacterium chilense TaxID=946677 RepID=A0A1M6Y3E8_9FLAO|nr:hypothetical protein [Flavobacterium chilense]SHL12726.1 hypothetical protein SAMN05444484_101395 [Flavobacterium chilense]